jgi:hypothetical protein
MRTALAALDHLVLATPDLEATAAWVESTTGVSPSPGGQHVGKGTRNMLCSFGPTSYLEIIGPDPEQGRPLGPRPFGLDELIEPGIVAWAIAVADIGATVAMARDAGYDPGDVAGMQRQRPDGLLLSWRLTQPTSTVVPFIIDWAHSPHPAVDAAPGLVLADLRARHPDPGPLAITLEALAVTMGIEPGPEALLVEIHGPLGNLTFP